MRHVRFLSRLLNRPQMIAPAAGAAVVAALMPGAKLYGFDDDPEPAERTTRRYGVANKMAIVPVVGEMVHRGSGMDAMSGLTSYQALGDMVSDALSDPDVSGVFLDIDSPGGEAAGCLDFAEWLGSMRGEKPIWASVNQSACSAAYAIASAADRVLIGEDGHAGSVGVVGYHTDLSAALAKEGVKITYLHAGARKLDGASALPLSDGARDAWQADIDATYDRFCSVVARNRRIPEAAVRSTEAAIFRGRDAIAAGLADEIATHEEALMAFAQATAPSGARMDAAARRGLSMAAEDKSSDKQAPTVPEPAPTKPVEAPAEKPMAPTVEPGQTPKPLEEEPEQSPFTEPGGLPADVDPDAPRKTPPASPGGLPADAMAVMAACNAAGFPALALGLVQSRASAAKVKARLEEAREITSAAAKVGRADMAGVLIETGVSLDGARKILFASAAEADARVRTDAAHTGKDLAAKPAGPSVDPVAVYAAMNSRNTWAKGH